MKLKSYLKKEQKLITWGITVGLVLGLGVWLIVLNDLGARLATVGAFIAAILTPVIAFIVNNFLPTTKNNVEDPANKPDSASRNSRIIVMSSLIALIVTVAVVWATPRVLDAAQDYYYRSFDTESIASSSIRLTDNTDMRDGDVAHVTLPKTNHQHLAIRFGLKNTTSTNLCTNAATLQVTSPAGKTQTVVADAESTIALPKTNGTNHLVVKLLFLPETDPSCALTIEVTSASYSK